MLVGPTALGLLEDRYLTSVDRQFPMTGLEIHANILQGLMEQENGSGNGQGKGEGANVFVGEASLAMELSIVTAMMGLVWLLTSRMATIPSGLASLLAMALYVWVAKGIYSEGIRLTLLYPVLGTVVMYFWLEGVQFVQTAMEKRRIRQLFSQFVAPEVVDEILKLDDADLLLESTRREVTVLFVDIRGFTPLSELTEPEVVVKVLNEYLTLTSNSIFSEQDRKSVV